MVNRVRTMLFLIRSLFRPAGAPALVPARVRADRPVPRRVVSTRR